MGVNLWILFIYSLHGFYIIFTVLLKFKYKKLWELELFSGREEHFSSREKKKEREKSKERWLPRDTQWSNLNKTEPLNLTLGQVQVVQQVTQKFPKSFCWIKKCSCNKFRSFWRRYFSLQWKHSTKIKTTRGCFD